MSHSPHLFGIWCGELQWVMDVTRLVIWCLMDRRGIWVEAEVRNICLITFTLSSTGVTEQREEDDRRIIEIWNEDKGLSVKDFYSQCIIANKSGLTSFAQPKVKWVSKRFWWFLRRWLNHELNLNDRIHHKV